ncbi:response regulator [Paraburkholderia hospita]|jgi:CheY-like chemotaxis protein|uniref:response regulator n=1 Tax=Paraburkholderia hospita TaxID=169430 RepID=UPI001FC9B60E|nr:response regulator [Paraburkholderia hospita]
MGYPVDAKVTREWATILLVDDDPNILRPLQLRVERDGYRVLTAPDGQVAFAAAAIERPSLIVTDWMMPRVDGVELCRRLKGDSATRWHSGGHVVGRTTASFERAVMGRPFAETRPYRPVDKENSYSLLEGLRPEALGHPFRQ